VRWQFWLRGRGGGEASSVPLEKFLLGDMPRLIKDKQHRIHEAGDIVLGELLYELVGTLMDWGESSMSEAPF